MVVKVAENVFCPHFPIVVAVPTSHLVNRLANEPARWFVAFRTSLFSIISPVNSAYALSARQNRGNVPSTTDIESPRHRPPYWQAGGRLVRSGINELDEARKQATRC
jgi:hypothetical protein